LSHHRFIIGNVLDVLKTLPDESVHCIATSPPYWGLRDYGLPPVPWPEAECSPMPGLPPVRVPAWEGCLGLEPTPEMYVAHLVLVFQEIRRVLRKDGTCWVVIGDSYAGSWGNYHPHSLPGKHGQRLKETARWNRRAYEGREGFLPPTAKPQGDLKKKDLVGIPWRMAFALQADGWWLRSDVVWAKGNPLPESTIDRPTKAHEYVFLLAKSKRYYYDAVAVAEPAVSNHPSGNNFVRPERLSFRNTDGSARSNARQWEPRLTRNRRSVWEVNTEPFPGAHFAVFPRQLVELCVKASTSLKACPVCCAPWERAVEKNRFFESGSGKSGKLPVGKHGPKLQGGGQTVDIRRGPVVHTTTVGFLPTCQCPDNDGSGRAVVLDPFGGAGTTTLVAMSLDRDSVYIDLSPDYAKTALERCGFTEGKLFDEHTWKVVHPDSASDAPAVPGG